MTLYTVKEVSQILKVNIHIVYSLINKGFLPAMKIGSLKVREKSLSEFIEKYENYDLTDLNDIKALRHN